MDEIHKTMNVIEATEDKETADNAKNNNLLKNDNFKALSNQNNNESEAQERNEKRKKFFNQYIYQQNYKEALRSLLWEPYDCRDDSRSWYYEDVDDLRPEVHFPKVPRKKSLSSSNSSLSSSCSYSSLEEILTVEMTQKSALNAEEKYRFNIEIPNEVKQKTSCVALKKVGKNTFKPITTKEKSTLLFESKLEEEEERSFSGFSESRCSNDPVQNSIMNVQIMVSDLDIQNGEGVSSSNGRSVAQKSYNTKLYASARQYEIGSRFGSIDCDKDVLKTVEKMLVTVEGTLEPRDSNEGTQLVSPENSLDLNDNLMRLSEQNRIESDPSIGNVSVVNCYRAVPVSVVSTVPTIKCLNTQENLSNVNIIQTSTSTEEKLPFSKSHMQTQAKKIQVRMNNGPVPSTSRIRNKVPRSINRIQNRHSAGVEGTRMGHMSKIDKERPKSMNLNPNEINSGQVNQSSGLCENVPTSSCNGSSLLSNHSRSISNPVLGNQTRPFSNRFGSQQHLPVRLETHFGPTSPDGTERAQLFLTQRNNNNAETRSDQETVSPAPTAESNKPKPNSRTFTSTEAQTDDVPLNIQPRNLVNREQRRRERRERRHQRRLHQSVINSDCIWQTNVDILQRDRRGLPDILNSHMPPPYSAIPMPTMPSMPPPIHVPPPMTMPAGPQTIPHLVDPSPGQPLPHQNGIRFPFPFSGGRRSQSQMYAHEEETPKSCCGIVVTQTVSIRWFIVMISFVGICCVIVGTVLGAMKASGREHLTVSLLMIGVGIVLVTVSVVAWRLTSQDAPSCRSMLGLGGVDDSANEPNQRFVPRMPPSYGRPHHPYAAMMYPEFQYRPPPPSYQASMQEYRLRLLLLERPNETTAGLQAAMSPPPTYRSQAGSTLGLRAPALCRSLPQSEYSHPPSYRSRTSSTRPTLDPNGDTLGSVNHSRNSSLLSHVSDQNGNVSQAVVNVISVMGNTVDLHRGDTDLQIDGIKLGVDEDVPIPPLRMLLNKGKRSPTTSSDDTKSENVNLVTIVTVSDNNSAPNRDHAVESDVLAHL